MQDLFGGLLRYDVQYGILCKTLVGRDFVPVLTRSLFRLLPSIELEKHLRIVENGTNLPKLRNGVVLVVMMLTKGGSEY